MRGLAFGSSNRLLFLAGQERGIRMTLMNRARGVGILARIPMVRYAREANHEMVRFLRAARSVMP